MYLKRSLLLAILATVAFAGPTRRNQICVSECADQNKFFYEIGRKYEYKYEAETRTQLTDTQDEFATLKANALVGIQPVSSCEYELTVSEISLEGSANSDAFAAAVGKNALRFGFENGKVGRICTDTDEEVWVSNFKKGILSTFQNSMEKLSGNETVTEEDVSGVCDTEYSAWKEGSTIFVARNKLPYECSKRPQSTNKLSSFGYSVDSLVQGLPIFNSVQSCQQEISEDIVKKVKCEETHTFLPFTNQLSGAKTLTFTTLELTSIKAGSQLLLEFDSTKTELFYEHSATETESISLEVVENLLSRLSILSEGGIKKEVPALFSELVTSLRSLTETQLEQLYDRTDLRTKKFIIDALPLVGTPSSMTVVVTMIINKEISEADADIWFTSLAFIKNPSIDMFPSLFPLVERSFNNKALLGISSLIHNYCLKNDNCESKSQITRILADIEMRIGTGCRATSEEEKNNILYALKALGNAGRFVNAESSLKRCYLEENPMEVRIAAIEAWRRVPCTYNTDHMLSAYSDPNQNTEIRIASYLALMNCPTQELIDAVKDRLTSEGVNQVATFVWTHLTNIQESAASEKQWVRSLIGEDILQKKFKSESLKFSRNFESSFFLREQNFGASAESNVIFSSESILPRSAMLNLTVDLFGESINLFEFGGRIEGFEAYIQKFFGPNGYYPEETIEAIIKNLREKNSKDEESLGLLMADKNAEPEGSYYLKIFGDELLYRHFNGIEGILPELGFSNPIDLIMQLVSTNNVDITKNYNLINSEFNFPTITGFPLNLKLTGTATVNLKLNGNFKFNNMKSIDIQGKLHPSGAVQIDGSMAVDAFVSKSGMKFVSTLHTSTAVEGKIVVEDGKVADITINAPEDKIEIFDMTSEFFKIENDIEIKETSAKEEIKSCIPILLRCLGMEICYEKSDNHLLDTFKMQVYLKKTDTHSSYLFHYVNDKKLTSLLFDMPGSSFEKKWSASFNRGNDNSEISIHSPFGSANGKIILDLPNANVGFEGELNLLHVQKYSTKFNFKKTRENNVENLQSELVFAVPRGELGSLKGMVEFDCSTKSFDIDISLSGAMVPASSFKLKFDRTNKDNSVVFKIATKPLDINLSGYASPAIDDGTIKLEGSYRYLNNPTESLNALVKYQKKTEGDVATYSASVGVQELQFNTDFKLTIVGNSYSSQLFGDFETFKWNFEEYYSYIISDLTGEYKFKSIVSLPSLGINNSFNHRIFVSDKKCLVQYDSVTSNPSQSMNTALTWNYGQDFALTMATAELSGKVFNHKLVITKAEDGHYKLEVLRELFGEPQITFEGTLSNEIKSDSIHNEFKWSLLTPTSTTKMMTVIAADRKNLSIEGEIDIDGEPQQFNVKVTPTKLTINSNIDKTFFYSYHLQPFSFKANIDTVGNEKRFTIQSTIKALAFSASGTYSPQLIEGLIKYGETEAKLMVKLERRNMEILAEWSPNKRFDLQVSYDIEKQYMLLMSLETPIKGWEKQEFNINFQADNGEIKGKVSATWKNTHHVGLTMDCTWGAKAPSKRYLNANFRLTSTLDNFELVEFTTKNTFSYNGTLNSKFEISCNSTKIKGKLDATNTDNGYQIDFSLINPFTEDVTTSMNIGKSENDITATLDFTYGSSKSKIVVKGNKMDYNNMSGSVIFSGPLLPEVSFAASVQTTSSNKNFEIKGKLNDQKFLLLATGERYMSDNERVTKLSAKLVNSSVKFFSFNYSHKIDMENGFEIDFDFNSVLLSNQSIKGHVEGKVPSIASAVVTGYLSGPSFNGMINVSHKIEEHMISSKSEVSFNNFSTKVVVNGNVDLKSYEGTMNGEIESTLPLIDGCKMTIQHELQGKSRNTFVIYAKDNYTMKIYHSITVKDYLNWSNYILFNDIYGITSEMIFTDQYMKHDTKITMGEKKSEFSVEVKYGDETEIKTSLNTPWTPSLQLTLEHKKINEFNVSEIKLDYGNDKSLTVHSEYKFEKQFKHIKFTIINKDWIFSPLSTEIKLTCCDVLKFDMNMKINKRFSAIVQVSSTKEEYGGNLSILFNRPTSPISFMAKYLNKGETEEFLMEYESNEKYIADIKLEQNIRSTTIVSKFIIPCLIKETYTNTITFSSEEQFKLTFDTIDANKLKILNMKFLLKYQHLSIGYNSQSNKGSLNVDWSMEKQNSRTFNVLFKSPFATVSDASFNFSYLNEFNPKGLYVDEYQVRVIDMNMKYENHEITLKGNLIRNDLEIKVDTSIKGWEKLMISMKFGKSSFEGAISKNDQDIQVSGSGNLGELIGEGELILTTPIAGFENNKIYLKYIISENTKEATFTSNIGSNGLEVQYSWSTEDSLGKVLTFRAATLSDTIKKNCLNATFENSILNVEGSIEKYNFNWIFKNTHGKNGENFSLTVTSNIPGWKTFNVETDINIVKQPYNVIVTVKREESTRLYSATISYDKNNIEMELISPIPSFENIKVSGHLSSESDLLKVSLSVTKNSEHFNLNGNIDFSKAYIQDITINLRTPFQGREAINFILKSNLRDITFKIALEIDETIYMINIINKLRYNFGSLNVNVHVPIPALKQINGDFTIAYDIVNEEKFVTFKLESEDMTNSFSFEGRMGSNEFSVDIDSPVEGFEKVQISGKYEQNENGLYGSGKYKNKSTFYEVHGSMENKDEGLEINANIPLNSYDNIVINGEINKNKIHLNYVQDTKPLATKEILITYELDFDHSFIKITTPFQKLSYFSLGGNLNRTTNNVAGGFFIHRNEQQINFDGSYELSSPMQLKVKLNFETSETKTPYSIQLFYDILSEKKNAGIILGNGNTINEYLLEVFLPQTKPYQGYAKFTSTLPGYKTYGFEYIFTKDQNLSDIKAYFALFADTQKTAFGVEGKLNVDGLLFALNTPFTGFENIIIEGKLDLLTKHGKANITIGSYKLYFETLIATDNLYVVIETPYEFLKEFNLICNYGWEPLNKFAQFRFICNSIKFDIGATISPSLTKPLIYLTVILPIGSIKTLEISGKYDIHSPQELFDFGFKFNESVYKFTFGYLLEANRASVNADLITPIDGWKNFKFSLFADFEKEDKIFNISLEKENNPKAIYISGKLVNGEIDFDVNAPLGSFGNYQTSGSYSRSKRSLHFGMMNDDSQADIIANFDSFHVKLTTPFKKALNVNFELSKNNKGTWTMDYKRNTDAATVHFITTPKKKGIDIKIESAIPGWELLALSGRLDAEQIKGYLSGQLNEEKMKISGEGTLADKQGSLTITIDTPYPNYKQVTIKFDYNAKRNILSFDASSNSSKFKIFFEAKRDLKIDVFVPNPTEKTEIKGVLSAFNGQLKVSSRFAFIRTLSLIYNLELSPKVNGKVTLERNSIKHFELETSYDPQTNVSHIMITGKLFKNQSMIHLHREGWKNIEFIFKRNEKEFKVNVTGSGNLPLVGKLDFKIHNSFREVPRDLSGKIDIDRHASPKKIKAELKLHTGQVYIAVLNYNANLGNIRKGDFTLRIVTPDRSMAPWKDISGNWNFDQQNKGNAVVKMGSIEFTLHGTIGIRESDVTIESNIEKGFKYFLQWKFDKQANTRHYFLKVGREGRYVLFKLDGTFDTIFNGDVTGAFRASRFMPNDFEYTAKWSRSSEGLSGGGTFKFGKFSGTHKLVNFKRNPEERSATFNWEATSNINNFKHVVLKGNYNLSKRVVDITLSWDTDKITLKGSLSNFKPLSSQNTISFHLPKIGDGEATISHDFTNPRAKSIKILGTLGGKKFSYIFNSTENENMTKSDFKGEIHSNLFGNINIHSYYDIVNLDDSKGGIHYSNERTGTKYSYEWFRKKTADSLKSEATLKSSASSKPIAHFHLTATWTAGFHVDSALAFGDKKIESKIEVGANKATAYIKTPFERFKDINVNVDYNFTGKSKTIALKYVRGERVIDLNFELTIVKKTGSIKLTLTSPFEVLKNLSIDGQWKKGKFNAIYQRNDVKVDFKGSADVKADKSSFNLKFSPPNHKLVELQFSYDLESFIKGDGKAPENLINIKLNIDGQNVEFVVNGYRNPDKVNIEINGSTSLGELSTFYLKLDSGLNLTSRAGSLEIKVNEFHFKMNNTFEKRKNGFYARSQMESTATPLPGLTIGFGREADSLIATIGYGDEREISFTFKGKDDFKKGFYGKIDIPRRGIHNVEFDVKYGFKGEDKIQVVIEVKLGEGKKIQGDIVYNSKGVKARLSSPWSGLHHARFRRSLTDDYFLADIGVDNYGITLEGDYNTQPFKKGFKVEGEIFGKRFAVNSYLKLDTISDSEGKLVIETPFSGYEQFGGFFKAKKSKTSLFGEGEFYLFHKISVKYNMDLSEMADGEISMSIDDLLYKISGNFINTQKRIRGNFFIETPHTNFKKASFKIDFDLSSAKAIEGSLVVTSPLWSGDINFTHTINGINKNRTLEITFNPQNSNKLSLNITYSFNKDLYYWKSKTNSSANGKTTCISSAEISFKTMQDFETFFEYAHNEYDIKGTMNIQVTKGLFKGELFGNVAEQHQFNADFKIPYGFQEVTMNFNYNVKPNYNLSFEWKKEYENNEILIDINSPFGTLKSSICDKKVTIDANISSFTAHIIIDNSDSNIHLLVKLDMDLPDNKYCVYGSIKMEDLFNGEYKFCVSHNEIKHSVLAIMKDPRDKIQLMIETPLFNINKINIIYNSYTSFNPELILESNYKNDQHSLLLRLFDAKKPVIINALSPLIPTGMAKLEFAFSGRLIHNFEAAIAISNAENTISSVLTSKFDSNPLEVAFELRTPFEGYEKTKLGFSYSETDLVRLSMFVDPYSFNVETYYGVQKLDSTYIAGAKINTAIENWKTNSIDIVMPLNKYEPKVTAVLSDVHYELGTKFNRTQNGGDFLVSSSWNGSKSNNGITYKSVPPFELGYELDFFFHGTFIPRKFHVMFDSSFIELIEIYKPVFGIAY